MSYRVALTPAARDDLIAIRDWIAVEAQSYEVADAYVNRIKARIGTLSDFPGRGSPRMDLGPDFRSIAFERRRTIIYRIDDDVVRVLRVLDGARDVGQVFG